MWCIRLQYICTGWFEITLGVRQGDTLSPTLFSLYVNDLVTLLNELNLGISLNDVQVTPLLYANDLVLVAPNKSALQGLLIITNHIEDEFHVLFVILIVISMSMMILKICVY